MLAGCDVVICKKYIFGNSDNQNILLTFLWSSSTIPGSQILKDVFCYANEVTFGKHLRMGAGCQQDQPGD